jgi:hypothetical protein
LVSKHHMSYSSKRTLYELLHFTLEFAPLVKGRLHNFFLAAAKLSVHPASYSAASDNVHPRSESKILRAIPHRIVHGWFKRPRIPGNRVRSNFFSLAGLNAGHGEDPVVGQKNHRHATNSLNKEQHLTYNQTRIYFM